MHHSIEKRPEQQICLNTGPERIGEDILLVEEEVVDTCAQIDDYEQG